MTTTRLVQARVCACVCTACRVRHAAQAQWRPYTLATLAVGATGRCCARVHRAGSRYDMPHVTRRVSQQCVTCDVQGPGPWVMADLEDGLWAGDKKEVWRACCCVCAVACVTRAASHRSHQSMRILLQPWSKVLLLLLPPPLFPLYRQPTARAQEPLTVSPSKRQMPHSPLPSKRCTQVNHLCYLSRTPHSPPLTHHRPQAPAPMAISPCASRSFSAPAPHTCNRLTLRTLCPPPPSRA
jgi:hypothetical protein